MKNSRTSLNKPFYDWIKQVREADKKIAELEDKLYYYNVKLIGYNSPNFEPRLSSTKSEYKDNKYIWLEKINKIEKKIIKANHFKKEYERFKHCLNIIELKLLNNYLKGDINYKNISKANTYRILNNISKKFLKDYL